MNLAHTPNQTPLAIQFHPEGYSMSGKIMGRQSAGNGFLKGWLEYAQVDRHFAWVPNAQAAKLFHEVVESQGTQKKVQTFEQSQLNTLESIGCLYLPGPGLSQAAWQRSVFGERAWSLIGVTFTTCSDRSMNEFASYLAAPVMAHDALICSSRAVRDSVRKVFETKMEYLRDRLGATRFALPQLPIIPFGVHEEEFTFTTEQRKQARKSMACKSNTVVVLFAGRLSFHAKAHPLAMYQALQAVALANPDRDIVLAEFGIYFNPGIKAAFEEAVQKTMPNVRRVWLDGSQEANRQIAWASADIFCSLSDNIQEAFGITPVEAMAAGLPVVVADWDGYKDTIVDGETGYLIPTMLQMPGDAQDIANRHALGIISYDVYIGELSAITSVDVQATQAAFDRLIKSGGLREQMGAAGKARVAKQYSWKLIIGQYQMLANELNENRRSMPSVFPAAKTDIWAGAMDPLKAFGTYPTYHLMPNTLLTLARSDAASWFELAASLNMNNLAKKIILPQDKILAGIAFVTQKTSCTALELQQFWNGAQLNSNHLRSVVARRTIMHLLKLGVFAAKTV